MAEAVPFPARKTAFVLSGGGNLGAVQVGMLYALLESGVSPDFVMGSSVGALNAGFLAGHPDLAGVETLADLWESIRRSEVFPFSIRRVVLGVMGRRNHLFDPLGLRTLLLRAELGFDRLEEAPLAVHVVATDMRTGEAVVLSRGNALEALMASAAIPGVFPPVEIDGRLLMDGSIAADAPVQQAETLGATSIFVLPTVVESDPSVPKSAQDMVLRAMTLASSRSEAEAMRDVSSRIDVRVVPVDGTGELSIFDFGSTPELIESAYARTQSWLEAEQPVLVA